jgi:hypothetical protein
MTGKFLSPETRAKLSRTISQRVEAGTWHNSFARSRRYSYRNESFDGTWELKLAIWFDQHQVPWVRNKQSFTYEFDKPRRYVPDFYLPELDCYVEVKGWKTLKDEAKWSQFTKKLIVLSGTDLQDLGLDISVRNDWRAL